MDRTLPFVARLFRAPPTAQHYYRSVDLLRGLAAIAVVFWHYQHFYITVPGTGAPATWLDRVPFRHIFGLLYAQGYQAVRLFWCISGFVFAAVYIGRDLTSRDFVVARVARLYPLHFVTLIAITLLQAISLTVTNETQIFGQYDLYHFVLNLLFIPAWGFERGYSFNAPIWSVSTELMVYGLFWLLRKWLFKLGIAGPAILFVLFFAAFVKHLPGYVWECGLYFFAGCTVFVFNRTTSMLTQIVAVAGLVLAALALLRSHDLLPVMALVAAAVLLAAAVEPALAGPVRRFAWIGDNTYSLYLWHVPIQVALLIIFTDRSIFDRPWFLVAYLIGLTIVARLSFVLIERPTRAAVRRRLGDTDLSPLPAPS